MIDHKSKLFLEANTKALREETFDDICRETEASGWQEPKTIFIQVPNIASRVSDEIRMLRSWWEWD